MQSILQHIKYLLSTGYGYLLTLITVFWNFIQPEKYSFAIVGVAVLFDLFWGVLVAIKRNCFILSEAARETFKKINIYAFSLLLIYMIERALHDEWFIATKVACAIAAACELWSISANMLIIKPDMPFLRIFQRQLKGEMEKKIGCELNEILETEENGKS
jgi:Holin family.